MQRLDNPLRAVAVADGLAGRHNATAQSSRGDVLVGLHVLQQFLLGHNTATMLHQVGEQVEHFWLDLAGLSRPA
jgi:hypothetical protein